MKRHFARTLIVMALATLMIPTTSGQREMIAFEKMGIDGSLPDASVVFQDSDNNIWLGSLDGLYLYDGIRYSTFRYDPDDTTSISGNRVTCIDEDATGRLWIGTHGYGLNVSDPRKRTFTTVDIGMDSLGIVYPEIHDIAIDSRGNIWISTDKSIFVLQQYQAESFRLISLSDATHSDAPDARALRNSNMYADDKDRIWFGTRTGMYMFDDVSNKWFVPASFPNIATRSVQDIEVDNHGQIWTSTSGSTRLWHLDEVGMEFIPYDKIQFDHHSHAIKFCFDSDDRIWASEFGHALWGYDTRSEQLFLDSRINSNALYMRFWRMPFTDASGNVWICGDGVFMYPYPKGFHNYFYNSDGDNSVSAIFQDSHYLWLGIRETGLIRYNIRTHQTKLFSTDGGLHSNLIYSICQPDDNLTILGTLGAIQFLENEKIIHTARVNGAIRALLPDSNGIVWASGNSGLYKVDVQHRKVSKIDLTKSLGRDNYFLQIMAWDSPGKLWIASESKGLIHFNTFTGEVRQFTPRDSQNTFPSWRVNDLALDHNHTLWLGTDVGLVEFNTNDHSWKLYNRADGLEQDFIASVICHVPSGVWVSTNRGLGHLDKTCNSFVNYQSADGLANSFYYPRVRFQNNDGVIFFGGRNGIDFFDPLKLRSNPFPPNLTLTSIEANGTDVLLTSTVDQDRPLRFDHNTDFIQLEFKSQYYSAPGSVTYEYRIDGLAPDWQQLGNRNVIMLTGLKPDNYQVHIRAQSPDGVRDDRDLVVPITIAPPFWETLAFRIAAIILICCLILFWVHRRENAITRKGRQEAELQRKMLDLEKKALLAQMNPHFIFNAMNSIQEYIFDGDNEGAMRYLTKFSRLLRKVIQASSKQHIALTSEIQLISDYIELEQMRFPNKFDYVIDVSPDIDVNAVEISPFIIQPQVENAILHGLMNKPGKGKIRIGIEQINEGNLKITVEDDGIGRQRATELSLANKFKHIGRATTIVKQRLMHNEHINGKKPFEIEDLYDSNGTPSGTRVEMLISTH